MSEAIDVLRDIDQLRRDLSGYHEQLKVHNDLQRHCDNQRERLAELEWLYTNVKQDRDAYKCQAERFVVENVKLREVLRSCVVLLTDHQFLHLPELLDETFKAMRELGIEVGE